MDRQQPTLSEIQRGAKRRFHLLARCALYHARLVYPVYLLYTAYRTVYGSDRL